MDSIVRCLKKQGTGQYYVLCVSSSLCATALSSWGLYIWVPSLHLVLFDTPTTSYTQRALVLQLFAITTYIFILWEQDQGQGLCASILVRIKIKWRPVACYSWCLAAPRRTWWPGCVLGACQGDCGSPKNNGVQGLSSTLPGWRTETLSERPQAWEAAKHSRVCRNVD